MQSNRTTHLSANAFKACSVAYEDFATKLSKYNDKSSKLEQHLALFENYTIEIVEHDVDYVINFSPVLFEGNRVKGGGSEYVIRKDTMAIEKRLHLK